MQNLTLYTDILLIFIRRNEKKIKNKFEYIIFRVNYFVESGFRTQNRGIKVRATIICTYNEK